MAARGLLPWSSYAGEAAAGRPLDENAIAVVVLGEVLPLKLDGDAPPASPVVN